MSLDHLAVFSFEIVCVWKLSFTKLTLKLRQSHRTTEANLPTEPPKFYFHLPKINIYMLQATGMDPHQFPPFYGKRSDFS